MECVSKEIGGAISLPHFNENVIRKEKVEVHMRELKDMIGAVKK